MIIYSVTLNIEDNVHDEWLVWMQKEHIPEVMATGLMHGYRMMRILTRQPDETGVTYNIQYSLASLEDYDRYQHEFAPALQQKTALKFAGKFVAWRTLLEEI
jgi:hypothetical protein